MKHSMYVIFDSCAAVYNKPFFFLNDKVAERAAMQVLQDPNSEIAQSPSDFTLYRLGTYDDTSATFDLDDSYPLVKFHELKATMQAYQDQLNNTEVDEHENA